MSIKRYMVVAASAIALNFPFASFAQPVPTDLPPEIVKQLGIMWYGVYFGVRACNEQGYIFSEDEVDKVGNAIEPMVEAVPQDMKDEIWTMLTEASKGKATSNDECLVFRTTTLEQVLPGVLQPSRENKAPF